MVVFCLQAEEIAEQAAEELVAEVEGGEMTEEEVL